MKQMTVRYITDWNAPKAGHRIIGSPEQEAELSQKYGDTAFFRKATSTELSKLLESEQARGRKKWAQLTIEIDDVPLSFWLPSELDVYCKVFATTPFPTARTLLKSSPDLPELNSHWLSRLPKKAKSQKFRERFLKYVASSPPALKEFRDFYSTGCSAQFSR